MGIAGARLPVWAAVSAVSFLSAYVRVRAENEKPPDEPFETFAVYVLSRGDGVPERASDVLRRVRELAEADRERGVAVRIQIERIGIEGERRLCLEYEDANEARRLYDRAQALKKDVDLVRIVVESCAAGEKREREQMQP